MNNMELYEQFRSCPDEAKKVIQAGRLKGFTDINPMWRIKRLTEVFGPCGIGWWYKITDKQMEGTDAEIRAFVDIELYYKWNGEVSQPVVGTGGASFLTEERSGAYMSDECYKMALTDAISVAAKDLGIGADVYFEKDRDKYTPSEESTPPKKAAPAKVAPPQTKKTDEPILTCENCKNMIKPFIDSSGRTITPTRIARKSMDKFGKVLCVDCAAEAANAG